MPQNISRRSVIAASAGFASCNRIFPSAGEFLGAPYEVDRRWFGSYDAARFLADGLAISQKGGRSDQAFESWRLRIGAFDVAGRESLSFDDGLSVQGKQLMQLTPFGIAATPFHAVQPGPNASYSIERALGDYIEVTTEEFSPKRRFAADFVAGKVHRDFAAWPQGIESEGLIPAIDPTSKLWGFTGSGGQFLIRPQYKKAFSFSGGFARVVDAQDRIGLINPKGDLTVPHKYTKLSKIVDGNCAFQDNDGVGVVNGAHRELRVNGAEDIRFEGGAFAVASVSSFFTGNEAFLISIKDGKLLRVPGRVGAVMPSSHGALVTVPGGKSCYLIGADTKRLNDKQYDLAQQSYGGILKVSSGGKEGWIDGEGKWIVEPRYQFLSLFKFGWALFKKSEKDGYGMVNMKGKEILEGQLFDGESLGRVIVAQKKLDGNRYQFVYYNTNGDKIRETEPVTPRGPR